jgi:hypothetical protein
VFKAIPLPPDGPTIHFSLQPNPSSGLFTLISDNKTIAKDCRYLIYDLQGRMLFKGSVSETNSTELDLSAQSPGIYWISIYRGNEKLQHLKMLKY